MNGLEQITKLADQLSPAEQLELVEHLAHRLRSTATNRKPIDLYGTWAGKFPDDLDIMAYIRKIRIGQCIKLDGE